MLIGCTLLAWRDPFQSAPPCGGRPVTVRQPQVDALKVSIRAPVRGATRWSATCGKAMRLFQSAPPCGGRPPPVGPEVEVSVRFQSAPPCGGRLPSEKKL